MKSTFLLICITMLFLSCTKDKDVLIPKENDEMDLNGVELSSTTAVPFYPIKRILVPVRGNQMVPSIDTKTYGNIVFELRANKTVMYKLNLYRLVPGNFATSAILFQGAPGQNGTPIVSVPFVPGDNGFKKYLPLTDDQFNALLLLLSPPILPLLPNSYFVITTSLNPTGLLRGAVQL